MSDYITLHNGINTYQYYNSFNKKVDKIIKSNDLESINNYRFVNCSFFMIYVPKCTKSDFDGHVTSAADNDLHAIFRRIDYFGKYAIKLLEQKSSGLSYFHSL